MYRIITKTDLILLRNYVELKHFFVWYEVSGQGYRHCRRWKCFTMVV